MMEWMPAVVAGIHVSSAASRNTLTNTSVLPAQPLEFANQRRDNTLGALQPAPSLILLAGR
jgi:hypothetical protein